MPKYAGIKDNSIQIISDYMFYSDQFNIIEIPKHLEDISPEKLITGFKFKNNKFEGKGINKSAKDLKVAFISNYFMHCGISTYAENLFPEIIKHIGDYRIFIEDSVNKKDIIPNDKIITCWERGQSLKELVYQIKKYNPDIVLLNHEWGIFPDPKYLLSFLTQISDYRTIAIMHSIFPNHLDKIVIEAALSEIVVHLDTAKDCLVNKKNIKGKVYVIPHGCYESKDKDKLWNIYRSNNTFIQVGFGLRYKNFEDSIRVVSLLKDKYKDVFFTAIFSESATLKIEHELYYKDLIKLIKDLNIEDNVGIVRGFQSDSCLDAYFRTNQVAIFPYKSAGEHFVYGSSGAGRLAMSKNIPVITSSIPHFSDLNTIKADTSEQIANELDKLFSDQRLRNEQIKKQNEFIVENSWENIAKRYIELFEVG